MPAGQAFEVVVIGAGVSGLAAAAKLARQGRRTLLLEGSEVPGGRCSLRRINGCDFDIGALYLGSRALELARQEFGLDLPARPAWVGVRWQEGWITLPPGRRMLADLARAGVSWMEIARLCFNLAGLFGERIFERCASVGQVVAALSPNPVVREVLLSGLGVSGVSPDRLPARDLQAGRGAVGTAVGSPISLAGGNGQLASSLLEVFIQAGGEARFGCPARRIEPQGAGWRVETGTEEIQGRAVISAAGLRPTLQQLTRAELWPEEYFRLAAAQPATLEVVNLFLRLAGRAGLPPRYGVFFLPLDVAGQFRTLEQGEYPFPPMFVLQIPGRRSADGQALAATLQFYHPAAPESPAQLEKQVAWVLGEGLERLSAGLSRQVTACQVYPPGRYEAEFGLRPYVFGVAPLAGAPRFGVRTPCPGLFLAGDSVEPARPSVPQALESGLLAAREAGSWLDSSDGGGHGR